MDVSSPGESSMYDAKGCWTTYNVGDDAPALPVYVTGNAGSDNKCATVVFSDVFGPHYGYHRKVCDELAARTGNVVLLPDLFRGDPPAKVPSSAIGKFCFKTLPWWLGAIVGMPGIIYRLRYYWNWRNRRASGKYNRVGDDTEALLAQVSEKYESVCAAGFCFGGYVICKAAATCKLSAIVGFHVSIFNIILSQRSLVAYLL